MQANFLSPGGPSHTLTVLSSLPLARRWPSGLKVTLVTGPVCLRRVRVSCPMSTSYSRTVPSAEALARRRPSGLNATR